MTPKKEAELKAMAAKARAIQTRASKLLEKSAMEGLTDRENTRFLDLDEQRDMLLSRMVSLLLK